MPCCHSECDSPTSTITVEIAPGPASIAIPNGIMLASCFSAPSCCSSAVAFVPDCLACSMSSPIPIRIIPPAILKAGSVMPNILKIRLPASANEHSTIAQVNAERRATPFRCRRIHGNRQKQRNDGKRVHQKKHGSNRQQREFKNDFDGVSHGFQRAIIAPESQ